jgi:hypothetical protein
VQTVATSQGAIDPVVVLRRVPELAPSRGSGPISSLDRHRSLWLRAESLAVFAGALWVYGRQERGWLLFVVLFVIPDFSLAANLVSRRIGTALYNIAHSYLLAAGLAFVGVHTPENLALAWAIAWTAHISFDRVVGLPYPMNDSAPVTTQTSKAGSHA